MKTLRISLNNLPLENTAVITMGQFDKKKKLCWLRMNTYNLQSIFNINPDIYLMQVCNYLDKINFQFDIINQGDKRNPLINCASSIYIWKLSWQIIYNIVFFFKFSKEITLIVPYFKKRIYTDNRIQCKSRTSKSSFLYHFFFWHKRNPFLLVFLTDVV